MVRSTAAQKRKQDTCAVGVCAYECVFVCACVQVYVASALAHLEPVNNAAAVSEPASKYLTTHASSDHQVWTVKFELYS